MNTQRSKTQDRFKQIVRTAGTVFARKGFGRTLISDIAVETGVSQGTIYNYFESKEALFEYTLLALYREECELPRVLPVQAPPPGQELVQARVFFRNITRTLL